MRKFSQLLLLLLFLCVFMLVESKAQCSMCRAVAESNYQLGANDIGKGLNDGILYLMGFPYIILGVIAFFIFRKQYSAKVQEQ
jgi:hypothetical protein